MTIENVPRGSNALIGLRLRELRIERRLQQVDVAKQLGVSAAYLNLIEKGKRAVQLPLLWKALALYGVEIEPFMRSLGETKADEGLAKLLDEPLLRSLSLNPDDIATLGSEPKTVTTITALFNLYKNTRSQLDNLIQSLQADERARKESAGSGMSFERTPYDEVTEFLQQHNNYFPALEEAAQKIRRDHTFSRRVYTEHLVEVLAKDFACEVKFARPDDASSVVRHFDREHGRVTMSASLPDQRTRFQLGATIGLRLLDEGRFFEAIAAGFPAHHAETRRLIKINLANYFAGALLLPYDEFFREVMRTRYDVDQVAAAFDTSFETVAHRMCNLANPRQRGIPMHFLRADVAGNISKRFSATGLRFAQWSGSCPKWAVHVAFLTPAALTKQYSIMPDGSSYFCVAKVVTEPVGGSVVRGTTYSIGLGTHADAARHLAYADEMPFTDPQRMSVPTGISCRFCERADCNQRAAPSYKFAFAVDEYTKKDNFFSPLREHEADGLVQIGRKRPSSELAEDHERAGGLPHSER
jgi:predicted transcriptional regulator/DNA-binding XRE family transcriptional regulator